MCIFWQSILFMNFDTQGGRGVSQNMTWEEGGGVKKGPILGDIIYEQPLIGLNNWISCLHLNRKFNYLLLNLPDILCFLPMAILIR